MSEAYPVDGPGWLLEVDPESDGDRLDRFIARRIPRLSRTRAARLTAVPVDAHHIPCGAVLRKSSRIRYGQHLWVSRPLPDEDLSDLTPPRVIDEDQDLLVLDKPSGWVAHPTASRYRSSITTWLKEQGWNAHPAHRLDLETSGLLLCGKTPEADAELKRLFLTQSVHKSYLAICRAHPDLHAAPLLIGRSWEDHTPLGFDSESRVGIKIGRGQLDAHTSFKILKLYNHNPETRLLIEAKPKTGRQHQIRAHLSLSGLPIIGDKLYGPSEEIFIRHLNDELSEDDIVRLGHPRHGLHAHRLTLIWRGKECTWECPLPSDLLSLLNDLPS